MRKALLPVLVVVLAVLALAPLQAEAAPHVCDGGGDTTFGDAINATHFYLTKPSNVVEGDLLIAQIAIRESNNGVQLRNDGWTRLRIAQNSVYHMATYSKIAGPDEPSSYLWDVTGGQANFVGSIIRFTGAESASGSAINTGASGSEMTAPSVNASADSMIMAVYTKRYGQTMTPAAGMDQRYNYYANQLSVMGATEYRPNAGLTGERVATDPRSDTPWFAQMIRVYPAPNSAPVVVVDPSGPTVTYGQDAHFYANVNGQVAPYPAVQWQVSANGGLTWTDIPGATSLRMTVTLPPVASDGNLYRCVFDNGIGGPVATESARLTVNPRAVTVTAHAKSKVYGESDPLLTYGITSGSLLAPDELTGALSRAAGEDAGDHEIQQGTLAISDNYSINFVPAYLTVSPRPVTVAADTKSKTYGDLDPLLTYGITSGNLVYDDEFAGSLSRASGEDVGSYPITQGSLTLGSNYAITYVPASLGIWQRPVTVTADDRSKTYGDADPALTYQISSGSLAFSDGFTGGLVRDSGESVGDYQIRQGTLALGSNYTLTYEAASLAISTRPITITADAKIKTYGDADPPLTYEITSGSLAFTDVFSGALVRGGGEAVGSYQIDQGSVGVNANYRVSYVPDFLTIAPRPITVAADAKTKVYGDSDPALTYQITSGNLVSPDDFGGSLSRSAGENAGSYAIEQGSLSLSANYALSYVPASLTISPRPITVTADPATKGSDEPDPVFTYQITSGSLAFTDAFTGELDREPGEAVGTYEILQGSLTLGPNYDLTYEPSYLTIIVRTVTVTADAKTKVYGDDDPALTFRFDADGVSLSDFTGELTRAPGEDAGTYEIQQGTLAIGGSYRLEFVPADLTISTRPITVAADAKTKTYGDVDPAFTYQIASGSLVGSDGFSGALTRDDGESVGSYAIRQGSLELSTNYTLIYVPASLTITRRSIGIAADDVTKLWGDPDPALTYRITAGSLAFADAFTGDLARAAGESPGIYAISQGTLALPDDYSLSFTGANLSIVRRPTTLEYTGPDRGQYSDPSGITAVLSDASGWGGLGGKTVTFTLDSQLATAVTESSGLAVPDLILNQSPGRKTLTIYFAGDEHFAPATLSPDYRVLPEQGVVTYIGAEFVSTGSAKSGKATIPLAFTIRDVTAVPEHPQYDTYAGDISNARLRLFIFDDNNNDAILLDDIRGLVPTLVHDGDTTIAVWAGEYEVDIGNSDARFYWVEFHLDGGWYSGYQDQLAPALVTVAKPLEQSIAGGGHVLAQSPAGAFCPDLGSRVNFGFNVKYNKNVTNIKGQVNIMFTHNGETYQIKSTALESLKLNTSDGSRAEVYSRANLINLTTGQTVASSGDTRLELRLTDGGEGRTARSTDTICIMLWNVKTGELLLCSNWVEARPQEQELSGGNIQVRDEKGNLK